MIKRAVMVTLHFILGGLVVGCVVLYMQDLSDFRGHEDQLYNKSVSPGGRHVQSKRTSLPLHR